MGYAMIGVLVGHIIAFGLSTLSTATSILLWLSSLIHTAGFLFLSGFGLFFSLSKDSDAIRFYKRRFYRFLLPFLLVAIPYFLVVTINKGESIWYYLGCISTIEFWIHGNYHRMWYIAISLVLYLAYPSLFAWYTKSHKCVWLKITFSVIVMLLINVSLNYFIPEYWERVKIGMVAVPYFFLGSLVAYFVRNNNDNSLPALLISAIVYVGALFFDINHPVVGIAKICFFVILLSIIFSLFDKTAITSQINSLFRWFGKYSLEIYILHLYFWFIIKNIFDMGSLWNILVACLLSIICCVPMHIITGKISEKINLLYSQND